MRSISIPPAAPSTTYNRRLLVMGVCTVDVLDNVLAKLVSVVELLTIVCPCDVSSGTVVVS